MHEFTGIVVSEKDGVWSPLESVWALGLECHTLRGNRSFWDLRGRLCKM